MKRSVFGMLMVICCSFMIGCSGVSVDGGEEVVFVKKPLIFGSGGVSPDPLTEGLEWKVFSTKAHRYDVKPVQYGEKFDDVITADNNPVDFNTYAELDIIDGQTPELHKNFGVNWYKTRIQEKYRTYVRNLARVHKMFELTTNPVITTNIQLSVKDSLSAYIKSIGLPVRVLRVTVGKVTPPQDVIDETIKTAAQVQRKNTEDARASAELNRMKAEQNKALADRAYMNQFGMTTSEYLKLRALEIEKEKIEMVKNKENVSVIFGSGVDPVPMFNLK